MEAEILGVRFSNKYVSKALHQQSRYKKAGAISWLKEFYAISMF